MPFHNLDTKSSYDSRPMQLCGNATSCKYDADPSFMGITQPMQATDPELDLELTGGGIVGDRPGT